MGLTAPKERNYLSADALFGLLRNTFAQVPDHCSADAGLPLRAARMSGFAMLSLQGPSLLDFDKRRADGNVHTIYGIACAPCDSSLRERLDPVSPEGLRPSFTAVFRQLQRGKALDARVFFTDGYVLALDGTGSFSSKTMHGPSCLTKPHRDGSITSAPQLLGAALIHPERRDVIPLLPEPMIHQDGSKKTDGERHAAKRCIAQLRHDPPHLKCIVTEDGLSANAPHIATLHESGCHSLLGGKEGDQASRFAQGQAAAEAGGVTSDERHDRAAGLVHRFRFVHDMPRNDSRADVRVNCIA